jgi:hypothetical protein
LLKGFDMFDADGIAILDNVVARVHTCDAVCTLTLALDKDKRFFFVSDKSNRSDSENKLSF